MLGPLSANSTSASSSASTLEPVVVVLALIVLFLVRRAYRMYTGTPVRTGQLFAIAGIYVVLFAITLAIGSAGIPWYLYALDGALLVVAAIAGTIHIRKVVVFERRPPPVGDWYFRLPPWIAILYVVLYVARIGSVLAFLGPNALEFVPTGAVTLSPTALAVLAVVDALFSVSTGILVGRSIAVYHAFEAEKAKLPPPSGGGPPLATGTPPTGGAPPPPAPW
jgi:hypothetical protein